MIGKYASLSSNRSNRFIIFIVHWRNLIQKIPAIFFIPSFYNFEIIILVVCRGSFIVTKSSVFRYLDRAVRELLAGKI